MTEPIIEFKTDEELQASLKEWQARLFLNDWIIKASICAPHALHDSDRYGECTAAYSKNAASILILDKQYFPSDAVEKYCAEQVLIHELLHCKYIGYEKTNPSIEECYFDVMQHALLEQMAKSLIMAKYNIPFDWFRNF